MSKRKLDKTDIGEMHCWARYAFHSGFPKVQVDSDHMIELCERALDNNRLIEENVKLRELVEFAFKEGAEEGFYGGGYFSMSKSQELLNQLKDQDNDK